MKLGNIDVIEYPFQYIIKCGHTDIVCSILLVIFNEIHSSRIYGKLDFIILKGIKKLIRMGMLGK